MKGHKDQINVIKLSFDDHILYSADTNSNIFIWDV